MNKSDCCRGSSLNSSMFASITISTNSFVSSVSIRYCSASTAFQIRPAVFVDNIGHYNNGSEYDGRHCIEHLGSERYVRQSASFPHIHVSVLGWVKHGLMFHHFEGIETLANIFVLQASLYFQSPPNLVLLLMRQVISRVHSTQWHIEH